MFKKYLYILSILTFILSGCEKIDIGESFICKVGDKIRVKSNFSFTVRSVNEYRCPTDVLCVYSGDVDVHLQIHHGLSNTDRVISLFSSGKNPIEFGGYTIRLLSVDPLPESTKTTPQGAFRINMMVLKN
jgi:hypothetical protein